MTEEQMDTEVRHTEDCSHPEIPGWIERDITFATVAAINQGGCASGAYMPAVTHRDAVETMAEYGNEILEYIEEALGELPSVPKDTSWGGMACFYLSTAVELWAGGFEGVDYE